MGVVPQGGASETQGGAVGLICRGLSGQKQECMTVSDTSASGTRSGLWLLVQGEAGARRKRPIYTSVRMLKTGPQTCHFLPLLSGRGGRRGRKHRAVCRIGTMGSEMVGESSGGARKKWQMRVAKWHKSMQQLFTMSRGRAEDGNRGGKRSGASIGSLADSARHPPPAPLRKSRHMSDRAGSSR